MVKTPNIDRVAAEGSTDMQKNAEKFANLASNPDMLS